MRVNDIKGAVSVQVRQRPSDGGQICRTGGALHCDLAHRDAPAGNQLSLEDVVNSERRVQHMHVVTTRTQPERKVDDVAAGASL